MDMILLFLLFTLSKEFKTRFNFFAIGLKQNFVDLNFILFTNFLNYTNNSDFILFIFLKLITNCAF